MKAWQRIAGLRVTWVVAGVVALAAIASRGLVLAQAVPPATPFTIACGSLASGQIGHGQSVLSLATAELSGTTDVWTNYVELEPANHIVGNFYLPAGVAA